MSIANTGGVATPTQANRAKKSNSADSRGARVKLESRMTHLSGFARDQLLLLPEAVDDYVDGDNPIRFIDAFVEGLDLAAVGFMRGGSQDNRAAGLRARGSAKALHLRLPQPGAIQPSP
jgi:hypothetical protein